MGDAWKNAERKVAKILGRWSCNDENALRRMPLQGRMMEEYLGDIIVNETASESVRKSAAEFLNLFMIDVKRRVGQNCGSTGWHIEQLLTCPKHQIIQWWLKLSTAATKYNKFPILIFTKGDRNWFIAHSLPLHKSTLANCGNYLVIELVSLSATLFVMELGHFIEYTNWHDLLTEVKDGLLRQKSPGG